MSKIINGAELQDLPHPEYKYITSTEEALKHLEFIERHPFIEVDTETTGLDPLTDKIVLLQLGVSRTPFVFDVREGNVDAKIFKTLLEDDNHLKLLQNASFDYEMLKTNFGIELNRMYDTMLAEQLIYLGLHNKSNLQYMVAKYLHLNMPKDIGHTFANYNQEYQEYQLRYAANDVVVLREIYNQQLDRLRKDGLMRVAKLEFDFIKPLAEMELNGMLLDVPQWRGILDEMMVERDKLRMQLSEIFNRTIDQTTLFGVSTLNLDSPSQVVKCLNDLGIPVDSTDVKELNKYKNNSIVKLLLDYRKVEKFITTYGERMINRIHPLTGRLHTTFKQMVDTGRMSSSDPNLQNIPKQQKYRSCFIAREGYKLLTCDMSQAELRILGAFSGDPVFLEAFANDLDLHARTAADLFGVSYDDVLRDAGLPDDDPNKKKYRANVKGLNFGLVYGLTKVGLSLRLGISETEAQNLIDLYFSKYVRVKNWLSQASKFAVINRYSLTVSGRRRYYRLPDPSDHHFNRIKGSVERQGKNHPIQGCLVADTYIKGIGNIDSCVNSVVDMETGFGRNTAFGVYSGEKDVYELKLSNGIKLGVTLDHIIPVVTNSGDEVDKKVRDIDIGSDLLFVPLNKIDGTATNISGYKYVKSHWRETYTEYKYPHTMNNQLAFVLGCLIGDGNYSQHNNVNFACVDNQVELLTKFNTCIKNLFGYDPVVTPYQKKNRLLYRSQVSSVVIRGFLKHIGLDYVTKREKDIPHYFFKESLKNKGSLLNGLFSTDGGVTTQSGPNYTTVSRKLAHSIHKLLFDLGINSNLKEYMNGYGEVYRIQIPKRFIGEFNALIGTSVDIKNKKLTNELSLFKGKDSSKVPKILSALVYDTLRNSNKYNDLSYNEKCHLRRFKSGSCSFTSWRKFYNYLDSSDTKTYLSKYLNYDFCSAVSLEKIGIKPTYDLICADTGPRYFTANGVVVHNSNADTIKQAMVHVVDRIKGYDARLLSTVHDEVIVEAREDQVEEITPIVEKSVRDGFEDFFDQVKMKADADVADYWVKG